MRGESKSKEFFAAFHINKIPAQVKHIYDKALSKRGSGMRGDVSKIINRFYARSKNGNLVEKLEHEMFTMSEHSVEGYQDEWHDGVCFEEVVARCLTLQDLKSAVYGKRVLTSGIGVWEDVNYHFKRFRVGAKEIAKIFENVET